MVPASGRPASVASVVVGGLDAPWALWLIAPLVVPLLAALIMWWRGRPRRPATTGESIASHRAYLDALGAVTRGPTDDGASFDG